jgi:hypothetical protein
MLDFLKKKRKMVELFLETLPPFRCECGGITGKSAQFIRNPIIIEWQCFACGKINNTEITWETLKRDISQTQQVSVIQ